MVADQQLGTRRMQLLGQRIANIAQPLYGNAQAFEIIAAQTRHRGGANSGEHAHGCMG
ncbi:hypothetical protein D9M71_390610 [compost metagenome]